MKNVKLFKRHDQLNILVKFFHTKTVLDKNHCECVTCFHESFNIVLYGDLEKCL